MEAGTIKTMEAGSIKTMEAESILQKGLKKGI